MLDTATAEHEAAHVVVGCALGLKLKRATIEPTPHGRSGIAVGYAWFEHGRNYLAHGLMVCAGIAWDRKTGRDGRDMRDDYSLAKHVLKYRSDVETGVRVAREILDSRRRAHARIASELCDRDLTAQDIQALVLDL